MALVLTCACGARFELDDSLAGVEIPCPECEVAVKAPDLPSPQPRTSYWALASIVLTLTGAFTVVGTVAAVVCGVVGLIVVLRQRKRLRGLPFAITGIVGGVVLTTVTVFALSRGLFANWGERMRETLLADVIDITNDDLVVVSANGRLCLTRPTKKWGRQLAEQPDPMVLLLNRTPADLTLFEPSRFAFVDVRSLGPIDPKSSEEDQFTRLIDRYQGTDSNADIRRPFERYSHSIRTKRPSPSKDKEMEVRTACNHKQWRILLRLCPRNGTWYLVRGYVPELNYNAVAEEMSQAMDSLQFPQREK